MESSTRHRWNVERRVLTVIGPSGILSHMAKHDRIGLVFRALESPVRRRLLEGIARKRQPIQELAKPLGISLPGVSKHLKVLEEAHLIRRHKVQRCYYFEIDLAPLEEADEWIQTYTHFWQERLQSLGRFLKNQKP